MTTKQHANGSRTDLYTRITAKIIADLERCIRPWHKPWNAAHLERRIARPLRHNGIPYQGINTVILWMSAITSGLISALWFTFRQALELGGNVRKGEHGEPVVYADRIVRRDTGTDGEEIERSIPFRKGYTVFNADQCENLRAHFTARSEVPAVPIAARCEVADKFFAATGAVIRHGGNRAYYSKGADLIQMPPNDGNITAGIHGGPTVARKQQQVHPAYLTDCALLIARLYAGRSNRRPR